MRRVPHGAGEVALHDLKRGSGPALLCLHELDGRAEDWRAAGRAWPGPVLALDFAGHGDSDWLAGGGYAPELFAADADVALSTIPLGPAVIVGAGIGAYVALLLAGSRPEAIAAAGLLPGRGLDGGGAHPSDLDERVTGDALLELADRAPGTDGATDPLTELCLTDLRPPDYAQAFAGAARALVLGEDGGGRPPWWQALRKAEGATAGPADAAGMTATLARLHGASA